jgi:hypothetical protein
MDMIADTKPSPVRAAFDTATCIALMLVALAPVALVLSAIVYDASATGFAAR